jgi:aminocarboxymuconate-semialdehyde decarboxylase
MPTIDVFTHVLPTRTMAAMEKLGTGFGTMGSRIAAMRMLHDIEGRFRVMDEFGDYQQIISLSSPPIEEVANAEDGGRIAIVANDEMAELVARHPARFPGFVASLCLLDPGQGLKEGERALGQLGAVGLQLFTDVGGHPLDHSSFDGVFELAWKSGVPIWLHPTRPPSIPDFSAEECSHFDMSQILGWPYATAVTMMRLTLTGLFNRFPGIRIITHHLGGMIPFHPVRAERGLLRESMNRSDAGPESRTQRLRRPPLQYLKQFYADTAMHGADAAVRCGLEFFGENRVLFATDHPFGTIQTGIDMIPRLALTASGEAKLRHENIERLVGGRLKG